MKMFLLIIALLMPCVINAQDLSKYSHEELTAIKSGKVLKIQTIYLDNIKIGSYSSSAEKVRPKINRGTKNKNSGTQK